MGRGRRPLVRAVVIGGGVVFVAAMVLLLATGRGNGLRDLFEGSAAGTSPVGSIGARASLWVDGLDNVGSTVRIDGDSVGIIPLWTDTVAEGERRVEVIGPGGRVVADTVLDLRAGMLTEFDIGAGTLTEFDVGADAEGLVAPAPPDALAPLPRAAAAPPRSAPVPPPVATPQQAETGDLRVTSSPAGAAVTLDGRAVGRAPLSVGGLRPGRHSLSLSLNGHETISRQVDILRGGQVEATVALRPLPAAPATSAPEGGDAATMGVVEVLVRPWGRIEIDGTTHRQETDVVYRVPLAGGPHRIRVSHPRLGSEERVVTVRPGERSRVEFDLGDGGP